MEYCYLRESMLVFELFYEKAQKLIESKYLIRAVAMDTISSVEQNLFLAG